MNTRNIKKCLALFIASASFLGGCQTIPKNALSLKPEALAQRQMQTRKYDTRNESKILTACAALLQDMGFNLDESETRLGLISASKMRSAVNAGEQTLAVLAALLGGGAVATSKEQKMRASVVTRPAGKRGENIAVRVTFQRIVWNTSGQVTKAESLKDPKFYQEFFDKLSKSIFLEAQEI